MKSVVRKLERVAPESERWELVEAQGLTLALDDGGEVKYEGAVLRCEPERPDCSVSFDFSTWAILEASLSLSLCVSADAAVKVTVNGEEVETRQLAARAGKLFRLHQLTSDATPNAEKKVTSRLTLSFVFKAPPPPGQPHRATILFGGERSPRVIQRASARHTPLAFLFFALAWFFVVGVAIYAVASFRPLGATSRYYLVLTIAGTWVAGVLNLPDLARIPLRPALRRLFGLTRRRRLLTVACLLLLSAGAGYFSANVVRSLYTRHVYTGLILKAIDNPRSEVGDKAIRDAFVLLPWRKEAQFLFERRAWRLRDPTDLKRFRHHVEQFVSDPEVRGAVEMVRAGAAFPDPLTGPGDPAFSDPVVWYAGLVPEGEPPPEGEPSQLEKSVRLLSGREASAREALIQQLTFEMEYNQPRGAGDDDSGRAARFEEAVSRLTAIMEDYKSTDVVGMYLYQIACDRLAQQKIRTCQLEEAGKWYKRLLDARARQPLDSDVPLWHRPPDKLSLYYMFRSYRGMEGRAVDGANQFLDFGACRFRPTFEKIKANHEEYADEDAWRTGTVLDDKVIAYMSNTLLNKGWRY